MTRGDALVDHLAALRREGRSWEAAWQIAAGRIPPESGKDGGAEFFRYSVLKQAYYRGGKPCRLDRDCASDPDDRSNGVATRGKSRPSRLVA